MGIYVCNLIFIHVVFSVLLLVIRSVWRLLPSSVGIKSYRENCICLLSTLLRQPRTALMESPSSSKNAPRRSKTGLWTSRCVLPLYVLCASWRIWIVNAEQDWKEMFCCFLKREFTVLTVPNLGWRNFVKPLRMAKTWWSFRISTLTISATSSNSTYDRCLSNLSLRIFFLMLLI